MALPVLLVGALPGCASSGGSDAKLGRTTTVAGIIRFRDFSRGNSLTLVSETMLKQVGVEGDTPEERTRNFSSRLRADANTKVCRDDVITGLKMFFEDNGFSQWAIDGESPVDSTDTDKTIELRIGETIRYMANPEGTQADPNEKIKFTEFLTALVSVYSEVPQYQSVEGVTEFKRPELSKIQREALQGRGGSIFLDGSSR